MNHNEWVIYGCDAGYDWVNQQCQPFGGDCAHGELIALASRTQDNHCGSCDAGYGLVNQQCEVVGVQMYGEYVAVEGFDQTFWEVRSEMGYEYHQRSFESFAAMLDWSAKHNVDWGWKEGGGYGQLFYQTENTGYTPAFGQVNLWERPVAFDSNDPSSGERISFVRKDLLLKHPSWQGTPARSAYVEETGAEQSNFQYDDGHNFILGASYNQAVLNLPENATLEKVREVCDQMALDRGAAGYFYQQHTNGHQICGFFNDAASMQGGSPTKHGHRRGFLAYLKGEAPTAAPTEAPTAAPTAAPTEAPTPAP